jgi:hypothetical protein
LTDGESKTFYLGSELAVFYADAGAFVNLMEISGIYTASVGHQSICQREV